MNKRTLLALTAASAMAFTAAGAQAQEWPNDTVTLVVPFAPGGSNDIIARYLAQELSDSMGQSVIVENRAGAGGSIGAAYVAAAEADGYTFLFTSGSIATSAAVREVPFDVTTDFAGVSRVATAPFVIVTREDLGASNVEELVGMAKEQPGELFYGSAGIGDSSHMATALFEQAAGIEMELTPYQGIAPAQVDLAGGRLDLIITTVASLTGSPAEGLPRLAYTTEERMESAPDMPTVMESGIDYSTEVWWGVFAPAATDDAIVDTMNAAIETALEDEAFKTFIADAGAQATPSSPAALTETLLDDYAQWTTIVETLGIGD
ncbi:Bug family tripartite tricarboxylate transporter substrate binding protein [Salipiger bermudensis]|uniref:Bug family tripartite tricarboxylate transporter substrate binding protein n=1 Tax=Salipiger bermudensis TaxID=344736 RepID=UPI001A8EC81D|nr:tripartite tricarboxylate transporter substrate-binding protein [Salipiger bermudensis]MBN9675108.1 hypothetical protein [Salipiger bermudensis]MBR9892599.1 tripartite tricarboxylate transporter substrate binding protein [bacterium]